MITRYPRTQRLFVGLAIFFGAVFVVGLALSIVDGSVISATRWPGGSEQQSGERVLRVAALLLLMVPVVRNATLIAEVPSGRRRIVLLLGTVGALLSLTVVVLALTGVRS